MRGNKLKVMMIADKMTAYIILLPEPELQLYPMDIKEYYDHSRLILTFSEIYILIVLVIVKIIFSIT
jgi:hypothetical protein